MTKVVKTTEIIVTAQKTGKTFPVTIAEAEAPFFHCPMRAFGVSVSIEYHERAGGICLYITEYELKKAKKQLETFFGLKLKSGGLHILLTEESAQALEAMKYQAAQAKTAWTAQKEAAAAKLPLAYQMHDFLDWGDYRIVQEQRIYAVRPGMPDFCEQQEQVIVRCYSLDNEKINREEWEKDFQAGEKINSTTVGISEQLAQKWMAEYTRLKQLQQEEKERKEAARQAKEQAEEARKKACFEQAKATGKPVLLHTQFLSGNQIPRRFQDEDSDMGNLNTYAMPDGTVSETFDHAY